MQFSLPRLFLLLFFLLLHPATQALVKIPPNITIPAVLVFGDSVVDTGNNNNLKTLVKCNFPPNGVDFEGRFPSGRFCDGKIPSDIIAEELGIKDTLPAYLDPTLLPQDLITGVSFASGGAGYDPLTSKLVSVISLSDQIEHFKEYVEKLKMIVGEKGTNFVLENSIFVVVAGSDDIANNYFVLRTRKLQYDVPAYTDFLADSATSFVQDLYKLGARRIVVFSAPPIGCVPLQRTLAGGAERECAEDHNQAAMLFNSKLSKRLDSLSGSLPNSKVVYADVYNPLLNLINDAEENGFKVANKGCCGTGNVEVAVLCNPSTPVLCANVSDHIFWDSYHPTERAYRTLISPLISKYVNLFF